MFRAADAFYARRREGPYRFIQNRSRISVVALKSDAAAEKPKDQLSRDFLGCSIFDFCNKIGQQETSTDRSGYGHRVFLYTRPSFMMTLKFLAGSAIRLIFSADCRRPAADRQARPVPRRRACQDMDCVCRIMPAVRRWF